MPAAHDPLPGSPASRDLTAHWIAAMVLWGPPALALVAVAGATGAAKTIVWTVALAWMGAVCLWNAWRCRRRHCFLTGPYFLVLALVAALHGTGFLELGDNGWLALGLALAVGGVLLTWLPDRLWGRYVPRRRVNPPPDRGAPPAHLPDRGTT